MTEILLSEQARDAFDDLDDRQLSRVMDALETQLPEFEDTIEPFEVDGRRYFRAPIGRDVTIVFRRLVDDADGVSGYLVASIRRTGRP